MVAVSGNITGLKELAKNSAKLKKSFAASTLRTALRNAAAPVRKDARDNAPREEGILRKEIKTKAKVTKRGYGYADIGFTERGFYGGFQELGTSHHAAQPFLRPALERKAADGSVLNAFVGALNKTIARVLRG